jgi:nicotianamine synthase
VTLDTSRGLTTGERIVALHDRLELLGDLDPGLETDDVFAQLVEACAYRFGEDSQAIMTDPEVAARAHRLRQLCADGEYRLERHWARRILSAPDGGSELELFPYLDNYRRLVALELHTVSGLGIPRSSLRRVCVLGAGPLPLTALLMARELAARVDAVDLDPDASRLATAVLGHLPDPARSDPDRGGDGSVRVACADARDYAGVAEADVVVLAALVGLDSDSKREVVAAVARRMRPGGLLLARSAHRLRGLLYPPLAVEDLDACAGGLLRPLAEVHPLNDVVNSLVVAVRA